MRRLAKLKGKVDDDDQEICDFCRDTPKQGNVLDSY
jgi:hypothetical protein